MPDWLVWLIVSSGLAAAETVTGTFVMVMLAGGATAGAVAAGFGAPVVAQIAVAVIGALLLLWLARPVALRHMHPGPLAITGTDRLVGYDATVLQQVTRDGGRVKLDGAEWSARAADPGQQLPPGTVVQVLAIDGATAVVYRDPFH